MKRIYVPIDFSGDSLNALEHAISIANEIKAHIRMMHVKKIEKFEIPFYFEELENTIIHTVNEYFDKIIERYAKKYKVKNGEFDFKIRKGSVHKEIINQTKYDDAHLIVLGTHGASGFEEFFIGSNAFKVVSNAPCPVITLRRDHNKHQLKKIVMPIDASSKTRQKIPLVAELALACGSEIHVLGVHETSNRATIEKIEHYMEQAVKFLNETNVVCIGELRKGTNNTETAIEYACALNADLIAITTEQTQNSLNLFMGSYAQQMVNHSPIPVLSVPVPK